MTTRARTRRPRTKKPATPTITFVGGKMRVRMSEEDLKRAILDLCKTMGLFTLHIRPARRGAASDDPDQPQRWETPVQGNGKGFPDLTIVGGWVMFRELKSDTGRVSAAQREWLERLEAAVADVGVWRPEDLHSGRIAKELTACRRAMLAAARQAGRPV